MRAKCIAYGPRQNHQHGWAGAFAEGLRRHGWDAEVTANFEPCDLVVVWSARREAIGRAQMAAGGEFCVLERGYIGDRFAWTSVSFGGGLNGRAKFRGVSRDPERFETHFGHLMQPWRSDGDVALIMGQVPGDMALKPMAVALERWVADMAAALVGRGYSVEYRPHPMAPEPGVVRGGRIVRDGRMGRTMPRGLRTAGGDLADALVRAKLVVTFNSNSGVDAVLAGVPTIATDIGSMAWPVTTHAVEEEPIRPDRTDWAAETAWKQFSETEMRSGECWERVKPS